MCVCIHTHLQTGPREYMRACENAYMSYSQLLTKDIKSIQQRRDR